MKGILASLALCALIASAICATGDWCYHNSTCNDAKWPELFPQYCNGSRQSPINIVSASAKFDANLTNFTFTNFGDATKFNTITNTGKTIKVTIDSNVTVSGGGLPEQYDTLQFHLHWGNGTTTSGSEHTVNGKRFPMELHIVNAKSTYNGNTTLAVADSEGLAALGFFIEATTGDDAGASASWEKLTSYLTNVVTSGSVHNIAASQISLDDLLGSVDRTKYYRYLGSLTTPACNEAVVWTVFKESIKIRSDLIDKFGTIPLLGTNTSDPIVNAYRNIQPDQAVTESGSSRNVVSTAFLSTMVLVLFQLWA